MFFCQEHRHGQQWHESSQFFGPFTTWEEADEWRNQEHFSRRMFSVVEPESP